MMSHNKSMTPYLKGWGSGIAEDNCCAEVGIHCATDGAMQKADDHCGQEQAIIEGQGDKVIGCLRTIGSVLFGIRV